MIEVPSNISAALNRLGERYQIYQNQQAEESNALRGLGFSDGDPNKVAIIRERMEAERTQTIRLAHQIASEFDLPDPLDRLE